MPVQTQEARIILAIEAIRLYKKKKKKKKRSRLSVTKTYNIPESTLRDRMNG
jgi:hypothetical protein